MACPRVREPRVTSASRGYHWGRSEGRSVRKERAATTVLVPLQVQAQQHKQSASPSRIWQSETIQSPVKSQSAHQEGDKQQGGQRRQWK